MAEPMTPAELFFLTHGPNFMQHPAFEGVHETRGSAGWTVAQFCDQCRKNPDRGKKIWQRHRAGLIDLPAVKNWWAYQTFEIFEVELDEYLDELF